MKHLSPISVKASMQGKDLLTQGVYSFLSGQPPFQRDFTVQECKWEVTKVEVVSLCQY